LAKAVNFKLPALFPFYNIYVNYCEFAVCSARAVILPRKETCGCGIEERRKLGRKTFEFQDSKPVFGF